MMANGFLVPAVIVAVASVVVQGLKALVDLIVQAKARATAVEQKRIAHFVAVCNLVDALTSDVGQRSVVKRALARTELKGAMSDEVRLILRDLI